jgi:hypothetical protein
VTDFRWLSVKCLKSGKRRKVIKLLVLLPHPQIFWWHTVNADFFLKWICGIKVLQFILEIGHLSRLGELFIVKNHPCQLLGASFW